MPRKPGVRYYESRKAYYTKHNGMQHCLAKGPDDAPHGPTYAAALKAFGSLMCGAESQAAQDDAEISTVIVRYYTHLEGKKKVSSLRAIRTKLDHAIAAIGPVKVRNLKLFHVTDWIDGMRSGGAKAGTGGGWNETSCRMAYVKLARTLNWAAAQGFISRNPLAGKRCPYTENTRGSEYVIPPLVMQAMIEASNPAFARLLRALRLTGARPGEIMNAEVRHYNPELRAIVFRWNAQEGYVWKNALKSKRDRVIFLAPCLAADVEEFIRSRKDGPLFPNRDGRAYTSERAAGTMFLLKARPAVKEALQRSGMSPKNLILYGFRHSYITACLRCGGSIRTVANLCGTSVKMIERHYGHEGEDMEAMRRAAMLFASPQLPS